MALNCECGLDGAGLSQPFDKPSDLRRQKRFRAGFCMSGEEKVPMEEADTGTIDLRQIAIALRRKRVFIAGVTLAALLFSTAGVNAVAPRYTAEARALIENQENFFAPTDRSTMDAQTFDAEAVQSQVLVVQSRELARRAVQELDLVHRDEFNPPMGISGRLMILFGFMSDPAKRAPEERVLDIYFERLSVYSPTKTRVLVVEFASIDPEFAAKAANTIMSLYLNQQSAAKRGSASEAAASLASVVNELKDKVAAAESKSELFRAQNGLLVGSNGNITISTQQLGELTTQLTLARSQQADAQAKAKLIRDMVHQGRIDDIPDIANNDLVRRIAEQRISMRAQLASESRTLLSGHPRIKELTAQLADLDSAIRQAADKIIRSLENDARIAGSRVDNLQATLDVQKKQVGASNVEDVTLRQYESEAKLLKDQLESTATRYQQALAREAAATTPADARVISSAVTPALPSYPRKLPIVILSTLAAFVFSSGAVLAGALLRGEARILTAPVPRRLPVTVPQEAVQARRSGKYKDWLFSRLAKKKSIDVAQEALPAIAEPVKAVELPFETSVLAGGSVAEQAKERPSTAPKGRQAERLARSLGLPFFASDAPGLKQKGLQLTRHGDAAIILALILDSAKKSVDACAQTALSFGRSCADEKSVILINLDPQAQALERLIDRDQPVGLAEIMSGKGSFAQGLHRDPQSRMHLVLCGTEAVEEAQGDLEEVLDALCETYELIILVAPSLDQSDIASDIAPFAQLSIISGASEEERAALDAVAKELKRAGGEVIIVEPSAYLPPEAA